MESLLHIFQRRLLEQILINYLRTVISYFDNFFKFFIRSFSKWINVCSAYIDFNVYTAQCWLKRMWLKFNSLFSTHSR